MKRGKWGFHRYNRSGNSHKYINTTIRSSYCLFLCALLEFFFQRGKEFKLIGSPNLNPHCVSRWFSWDREENSFQLLLCFPLARERWARPISEKSGRRRADIYRGWKFSSFGFLKILICSLLIAFVQFHGMMIHGMREVGCNGRFQVHITNSIHTLRQGKPVTNYTYKLHSSKPYHWSGKWEWE